MLYLIAALLCSAMVSIVLKAGERWEYDRYGMLMINYLSCLIPFVASRLGKPLPSIDADLVLCLAFAAANGFLYIAGMVMNQINVRRNGAMLQSAFSRLGVMVPTCLSIICFGERPSIREIIGIALVVAAFLMMNIPQGNNGKAQTKPAIFLLLLGLLTNGLVDSMLKVFEVFGRESLNDWFMGSTFIFAALLCLIVTMIRHGRIGKHEVLLGLCLGIPNYLSSLLLLKSLSSVSAYIAYPTYSVGAILTVMLASTLIFRERLSRWSLISIAAIIPAILLLNI